MKTEIIIAIISAVFGGLCSYVATIFADRRKAKREECLEEKKLRRESFLNRPEMEIIDYRDYMSRTGYGIKQKCDIEIFAAHIENVTVEGDRTHPLVYAHYSKEQMNTDEWCCVIYSFKNVGKTNISVLDIICNYKRDTCIFPCAEAMKYAERNLLNYSYCYDRKIRIGDTTTVKICYHKDAIITGIFSAILSVGMRDDNGKYWTQPLFAPQNKVYDSRPISPKDYTEELRYDIAEECFRKPWLW